MVAGWFMRNGASGRTEMWPRPIAPATPLLATREARVATTLILFVPPPAYVKAQICTHTGVLAQTRHGTPHNARQSVSAVSDLGALRFARKRI